MGSINDQTGRSKDQDIEHLRQAAKQGDAEAQYNLVLRSIIKLTYCAR